MFPDPTCSSCQVVVSCGPQLANERLMRWLTTADAPASWTTSVCTGALILGAAGLLRGRRATTHWRARDYLARHGATYIDERVVTDGTLITSGGVTAGIDMALALTERLAGADVARAVQLSAHYCPNHDLSPLHHITASPEILALVETLGP